MYEVTLDLRVFGIYPFADDEDGYFLEIFNALGETMAVVTVAESAIAPLTANEVFSVRPLALQGAMT